MALGIGSLILAAIEAAAVAANFSYVLGFAAFAINNFFAYFTIQSALAAIVMFVTSAVIDFHRDRDPAWLDVLRTLVTTYIVVSGIVFALIVIQSQSQNYHIEVPVSDQVLHFWIPALALVDWLIDPRKARLSFRLVGWVVVYPIVWGVFTLIRGPLVGWYPYFFLDARQVTIGEMVLYCGICIAFIAGIGALLIWATHLRLGLPWRDDGLAEVRERLEA